MENAVKYRIFVKDANSFATERTLEALLTNYLAFLSPLIGDFIWQYEPFYFITKDSKGLWQKYFVRSAMFLAACTGKLLCTRYSYGIIIFFNDWG